MRSSLVSPRLAVRLVTLGIWALATGSAVYWALWASSVQSRAVPPAAGAARGAAVDSQAVARALGAVGAASAPQAAAPDIVSRLALRGIVTHGGGGAALISVGDQPAKPFRVGAEIEGGWTIKSVSPDTVVIGSGSGEARLNMPLPSERSQAGAAAPPSRPPIAVPPRPQAPSMQGRPRA